MNLRAGLVGLGVMGSHHANVMHGLAGVHFVAAADPAGDVHGAARGIPVVGTVADLLSFGLDYCVVAVPASQHVAVASVLAEAGVHTLVEKPIATDSIAAYALADAFERAGLVNAVGYTEIYNPTVRTLHEYLKIGFLGSLHHIGTRRQGPAPRRVVDVGVVKDLATHDIALVTHVTGQTMTSIAALTAAPGGEHEDLVAAIGRLADGTITTHLANWLSPFRERVTVTIGERGCLVADTLKASLTYYPDDTYPADGRESIQCEVPYFDPLRAEHEAFRDAVLGEPAQIISLREGAAVIAVADAMVEAAPASAGFPPVQLRA